MRARVRKRLTKAMFSDYPKDSTRYHHPLSAWIDRLASPALDAAPTPARAQFSMARLVHALPTGLRPAWRRYVAGMVERSSWGSGKGGLTGAFALGISLGEVSRTSTKAFYVGILKGLGLDLVRVAHPQTGHGAVTLDSLRVGDHDLFMAPMLCEVFGRAPCEDTLWRAAVAVEMGQTVSVHVHNHSPGPIEVRWRGDFEPTFAMDCGPTPGGPFGFHIGTMFINDLRIAGGPNLFLRNRPSAPDTLGWPHHVMGVTGPLPKLLPDPLRDEAPEDRTRPPLRFRLCDDTGVIGDATVGANGKKGEAAGVETCLERLNRWRALGGAVPYTGEPFACAGVAHLAGRTIHCTSRAHKADPVETAAVPVESDP